MSLPTKGGLFDKIYGRLFHKEVVLIKKKNARFQLAILEVSKQGNSKSVCFVTVVLYNLLIITVIVNL